MGFPGTDGIEGPEVKKFLHFTKLKQKMTVHLI